MTAGNIRMTTVKHADPAKTGLIVVLRSMEHHSHGVLSSFIRSHCPARRNRVAYAESQRNYRRERHPPDTMPASHLQSISSGCSIESRRIHTLPTNTCLLRAPVETRRTMELLTRIAPRIFTKAVLLADASVWDEVHQAPSKCY